MGLYRVLPLSLAIQDILNASLHKTLRNKRKFIATYHAEIELIEVSKNESSSFL